MGGFHRLGSPKLLIAPPLYIWNRARLSLKLLAPLGNTKAQVLDTHLLPLAQQHLQGPAGTSWTPNHLDMSRHPAPGTLLKESKTTPWLSPGHHPASSTSRSFMGQSQACCSLRWTFPTPHFWSVKPKLSPPSRPEPQSPPSISRSCSSSPCPRYLSLCHLHITAQTPAAGPVSTGSQALSSLCPPLQELTKLGVLHD